MIKKDIVAILLGFLAALWLGVTPAAAQTPNRAGVVVVHEDGVVDARCVGFAEAEISGFELLTRAGFTIRSEASSMGATICSVDGQGCGEGENCFCQCQSGPCRYWTYWRAQPEGWEYSSLGAGNTVVTDGVLEAWVWGEGERGNLAANGPPALEFAEVCAADAPLRGWTEISGVTGYGVEPWLLLVIVLVPFAGGLGWWWVQRRRVEGAAG